MGRPGTCLFIIEWIFLERVKVFKHNKNFARALQIKKLLIWRINIHEK